MTSSKDLFIDEREKDAFNWVYIRGVPFPKGQNAQSYIRDQRADPRAIGRHSDLNR